MRRIYFASNRNVRHETSSKGNVFGERFNADGPQIFRVGHAEVTCDGDPKDDDAWHVGDTRLYPETLDATPPEQAGAKLGSARMFDDLRQRLKDSDRDVIILIHGFANTFQNSLIRAAALEELYGAGSQDITVILFSWPSNGRVQPSWNYFADREDAEASGLAMGRALKRLVEFLTSVRQSDQNVIEASRRRGGVPDPANLKQCTARLHVLAHSMGNYALRFGIQKFIQLNRGVAPRVFDAAFLMAADEDADALAEPLKLRPLDELASRVFVYHADNDIALTISDRTKGNPDRLGSDGPNNLDRLNARVMAVDCKRISPTEPAHGRHQYYRLRNEAIEDIRLTLADAPQEGRPGRLTLRPGRAWQLIPN